jgi:hypothetical protein
MIRLAWDMGPAHMGIDPRYARLKVAVVCKLSIRALVGGGIVATKSQHTGGSMKTLYIVYLYVYMYKKAK